MKDQGAKFNNKNQQAQTKDTIKILKKMRNIKTWMKEYPKLQINTELKNKWISLLLERTELWQLTRKINAWATSIFTNKK
jgi:hypothetical protein